MTKLVLKIKGMHCASCSILVDKLIGKQAGVAEIKTNYGSEKTSIEFDETKISLEKIDELINKLGYDLIRPSEKGTTAEEEEEKQKKRIEAAKRRVVASFTLALPIIIYYMLIHMFNVKHVHAIYGIDLNYIYWALSTPIQFVISWPFYRNSWTSIKVGSANMDVLVVLGTSAAYFYSMIGFLFFNIDHPFWESSAALLSFIVLGRYFEMMAKGRASEAIKELLKLEAKESHILRGTKEITVPIDQVQVNDMVIVRSGEKIPVDGVIIEGETHIDEKVVTGESFPVSKTVGDEVIGSTVNQEGLIKFKATKVGKDTLLYQIIQMVEEAQTRRAPVQDLVDKISEYFVPAVIVIALITFSLWYFVFGFPFRAGLLRLIAVLVISCPCAMGLATPTALIVGIGRAAKYGIILKGGEALEKAYKVMSIAFDKTGTLTLGKPVVTNFVLAQGFDQKETLRLIASVETGSDHPLSRAIIEKGKREVGELLPVREFENVSGLGVKGRVDGKEMAIGNAAFMDSLKISTQGYEKIVEKLQNDAKTVVYGSIDKKIAAVIAMADALKPFSKDAIAWLRKMGKEIIMITGDNPKTAQAIAREVNIDTVLSQVLPREKANVIKSIQDKGKTVAMVGDGINDSPALAQADVGIAIGSGTDVAIEAGEIILVKDDLRDVVTSIQISKRTINKVWQNLFWAFIYNVLAIPIAAGALYPVFGFTLRPEMAGFAMAFSSVSVVTNSLLLKRFVPSIKKQK